MSRNRRIIQLVTNSTGSTSGSNNSHTLKYSTTTLPFISNNIKPSNNNASSSNGWTSNLAIPSIFNIKDVKTTSTITPSTSKISIKSTNPSTSKTTPITSTEVPTHPILIPFLKELSLTKPNTEILWNEFLNLNLNNLTNLLNSKQFSRLILTIFNPPLNPNWINVDYSTSEARKLTLKLELIRTKFLNSGLLNSTGGELNRKDWSIMLRHYASIYYAPGVIKMWEELISNSKSGKPSFRDVLAVSNTIKNWINLHHSIGGRNLSILSAKPLISILIKLLSDVIGDSKKTTILINSLLETCVKGNDLITFDKLMKNLFGFNIWLPGSEVYPLLENELINRRIITEKEVNLVLEILGEKKELSAMMAVFEVCDSPSPSTSTSTPSSSTTTTEDSPSSQPPTFFQTSFHPFTSTPTTPTTSTSTSTSTSKPIESPPPHLIGTTSYVLMIEAAGQSKKGSLVRHYFNELILRWSESSSARISQVEELLGITYVADVKKSVETVEGVREGEGVEGGEKVIDSSAEIGTGILLNSTVVDPIETSSSSTSTATVKASPSSPSTSKSIKTSSIPQPASPYSIRATLIKTIVQTARTSYDSVTSRYIRNKSLRLLQLLELHQSRLKFSIKTLQELLSKQVAGGALIGKSRSLPRLERELEEVELGIRQIRLMLEQIKLESNILLSWRNSRRLNYKRLRRFRTIYFPSSSPSSTKPKPSSLKTTLPSLRRKESQLLKSKIWLARYRLKRLQLINEAHLNFKTSGDKPYERLIGELKGLNGALIRGLSMSGEGSMRVSSGGGRIVGGENGGEKKKVEEVKEVVV